MKQKIQDAKEYAQNNKYKLLSVGAKGVVGALPIVGPIIAEILGEIIPNQRLERIEEFLEKLNHKLEGHDLKISADKMKTPESIDLLEDSFLQASKALSEERISYIASLMKNSITDEELEHVEYKRVLQLLGQLNDVEVLILQLHSFQGNGQLEKFLEIHGDVLTPLPVGFDASQDEVDKNTIFKSHSSNLVNLGLLVPRYKKVKKGEFPEFDRKTGKIKSSGHTITNLGRLVLRSIDQLDNN